jgi:hypothetical protein
VYSDNADEGRVYHGSAVADGAGNWSFPGAVVGPNVTATATNAGGSTSEFSAPFACSGSADSDGDSICNSGDNCPGAANTNQANGDGDAFGDACDACPGTPDPAACADDDNDGYTDDDEAGMPLCTSPGDDDDDGTANDGCPGGPAQSGPFSEAQFNIGTGHLDACGLTGWPSNVNDDGPSANKLDILDVTRFVAPFRRFDTSPGHPLFNSRWDISPGKGGLTQWINILDITTLISGPTGNPPMLAGARAFDKDCPFPP